jgi:hypothetical protein
LQGKPHPYADQSISFAGVAHSVGISQFWIGGSKLPAIYAFSERILVFRRDLFCKLMIGVVRKGLIYRNKKGGGYGQKATYGTGNLRDGATYAATYGTFSTFKLGTCGISVKTGNLRDVLNF